MTIQMRCFRCGWTISAESVSAAMLAEDAHNDECQPAKQIFIHPANKPGFFYAQILGENTMSEFSVVDTAWIRDRAAEGYADHKFGGYLFDRWLDQVKADAWDKAIEHVSQLEADVGFMEHYKPHNPYRGQEEV